MSSSPPSAETNDDTTDMTDRPTPQLNKAAFVATSHDILGMLDAHGVDDPSKTLSDAIIDGDIQNYRATETTDGTRQVSDAELLHAVEILNQGNVATTAVLADMIGYENQSTLRRLKNLREDGRLTSRDLGNTQHWECVDESSQESPLIG